MSAFYQINTLVELAHRNNSLQVQMSLQLDTLSWFRANQSLLLLLNAACLEEKLQIQKKVFDLTPPGLEPTIYHTRGEHVNDYTTDERLVNISGLFLSEYILST